MRTITPKGDLTFEICGGLTNQRIAIIQGLMIARLTERQVLLPQLNPNGVQRAKADYAEDRTHLSGFDLFYNVPQTAQRLSALGIFVKGQWDGTAAREASHGDIQECGVGRKMKDQRYYEVGNMDAGR